MDIYKNILQAISKANDVLFLSSELYLELTFNDSNVRDECISLLGEYELESRRENILRISLEQKGLKIFYDNNDFRRRINKNHVNNGNFRFNVFVLNNKGSNSLFYNNEETQTYLNFVLAPANNFFQNTLYYFKLLSFLKNQEHQEDHHFYFVDHFNADNRKIIFTSLKKEGKLTVGYPQEVPDFNSQISIKSRIERFISCFNEKQLPKFLKAELFNILPSFKQEERLEAFIKNLDFIIEKAEQNFEIYLSELSLDNFKNQYLEFRLKYFSQFRDILSKITTQILAFPLSITASTFATYKVIDSIVLCIIIVAAFIAFSIYSLFMMNAQKEDVNEIIRLFNSDYSNFSKNNFFEKYPNELTSFKETYEYIHRRSDFLIRCIKIYSTVLIFVNSFFVFFILFQVFTIKISIVIGSGILIFLLIISILIYYGFLK
jgi:hypothetical protein